MEIPVVGVSGDMARAYVRYSRSRAPPTRVDWAVWHGNTTERAWHFRAGFSREDSTMNMQIYTANVLQHVRVCRRRACSAHIETSEKTSNGGIGRRRTCMNVTEASDRGDERRVSGKQVRMEGEKGGRR